MIFTLVIAKKAIFWPSMKQMLARKSVYVGYRVLRVGYRVRVPGWALGFGFGFKNFFSRVPALGFGFGFKNFFSSGRVEIFGFGFGFGLKKFFYRVRAQKFGF